MWCIAVDPAAQGKGVGRRLMRATLAIADKIGVPCYTETNGKKKPIIFQKYGPLLEIWLASYAPFYAFIVFQARRDAEVRTCVHIQS